MRKLIYDPYKSSDRFRFRLICPENGNILFVAPPMGFPTAKKRNEAVAAARRRSTQVNYEKDNKGHWRASFVLDKTVAISSEGNIKRTHVKNMVELLRKARLVDKAGKAV